LCNHNTVARYTTQKQVVHASCCWSHFSRVFKKFFDSSATYLSYRFCPGRDINHSPCRWPRLGRVRQHVCSQ